MRAELCCGRPACAEWGVDGAFPELEELTLDLNPNLGAFASLPDAWGTGGGLPSLRLLSMRSCNLSGTLPDTWAAQLNLTAILLDSNTIAGMLRALLSSGSGGGWLMFQWGTLGVWTLVACTRGGVFCDLSLAGTPSSKGPVAGAELAGHSAWL